MFLRFFGSHTPLHAASPAARRKSCVNGFSCNVVIISSRLFLVLITKLLPSFSLPPLKNAVHNRFLGGSLLLLLLQLFSSTFCLLRCLRSFASVMFCCSRLKLMGMKRVPPISKLVCPSYFSHHSLTHCESRGGWLRLKLSLHEANLIQDLKWPQVFFLHFIVFSFFFQLRLVDISHCISIIGNLFHRYCLKGGLSPDMSTGIPLFMS